MRERKDRPADYRTDMRTLVLTLTVSLFIAMLAFFIVLNSFSSSSTIKSAAARDSINASFGSVGMGTAMIFTGDEGQGGASDAEAAAAAGLRSVLPDLGFESRKTGDKGQVMAVVVPRADLEERWPALRARIADVLSTNNPGGRRSIHLLALDGPAQAQELVTMAEELSEEGVEPDMIGIGYENRGRNAVEIRFVLAGR